MAFWYGHGYGYRWEISYPVIHGNPAHKEVLHQVSYLTFTFYTGRPSRLMSTRAVVHLLNSHR